MIADHLATLLANLNYTIEARWAKVAAAAMETSRILSVMAKDPKNADLVSHVERLRRHLGRKTGAKRKKTGEPPTGSSGS